MVFIPGQTEEDMKGNIKMIKSMALVHTLGQMEGSIEGSGKMIRGMAKGNT